MKLKLKTAILKLLFILKEILFKKKYKFLNKSEKNLKLQLKQEVDPKRREGIIGLLNVVNHIHRSEYRKRKLNHFKPIKQKDGKARNRQSKNS